MAQNPGGPQEKHNDFLAKAIANYDANTEDELTLQEDAIYSIIQTDESGWWYAMDSNLVSGWAPSNFLQKLDTKEQQKLIKEKTKNSDKDKQKNKQKKQKKNNNNNHNNNNVSGGKKSATKSKQQHKQQKQQQDSDKTKTFKIVDTKGNDVITLVSPKMNTNSNGKSDGFWDENKDNKAKKWRQLGGGKKWQHFTSENESKEKELKERDIEEEKKYESFEKPKFTTIGDPNPDPMAIFKNNNKPINEWSVNQLMDFLIKHPNTNNTFQLKSAVSYLNTQASKDVSLVCIIDLLFTEIKEWVLKNNGLNVILNVLRHCDKDIAVSMSCCLALATLCERGINTPLNAPIYTAEKAGVFYLTTAIRSSFKNARFCYAAFNCICNFTHRNERHKSYIIDDEHNKSIIKYIIEGMQKFRYSEDSSQLQNKHCARVQTAACLALQNLATDSKGQEIIGKEGVSQVLDALIAFADNIDVASPALGTLSNLLANESNGIVFLQEDGLTYLITVMRNSDISIKDKIICARLMHHLAIKRTTAAKLAKMEETIDACMELLNNADFGSELYNQALKVVNTLVVHCSDIKRKEKLMKEFSEANLIVNVGNALTEPFSDLMEHKMDNIENRKQVSSMYVSISTILFCYFESKNKELSSIISENSINADQFIPNYLIKPCVDCPSPRLLFHMMSMGFKLSDNTSLQTTLIEGGVLDLLFGTDWYKTPHLDDNVLRLGCGFALKLLSSYANHRSYWTLADNIDGINAYTQWLKQNKPQLHQLCSLIQVE